MLRAVFIGYDNRLNHCVAHRLSQETNLVGNVWLDSSARWHTTWSGRRDFLKKRIKRRGVLKTADEMAYYVYHHATDKRSRNTRLSNELVEAYWNSLAEPYQPAPSLHTGNVNSAETLAYIDSLQPDIIFAHCLNQFFGKRLRSKAKHGIFMWHVGITPEYKGLYSPFWTMYNGDYDNFGYSIIHLNDDLDAGEVYVQRRLTNVDVRNDNHVLIEHKAILDSLDHLQPFLQTLEAGTAKPIERPDARSGYYSYPGLTDFLIQRARVRAYRAPERNDSARRQSVPTS
jgi:Formyl transferase